MSLNNKIISLEIYDCCKLKQFKSRDEKTKFIVQGENYCKIYDKIKGVDFFIDNLKVMTSFIINTKIIPKFDTFLQSIKHYYDEKNNKSLWRSSIDSSKNIISIANFKNYEKQIRSKSHLLYPQNSISIDEEYICTYDTKNNPISLFNKKIDMCEYKKFIGGIIFDNGGIISFINDNLNSNDKSKNIVIADEIPSVKSDKKFIFKQFNKIDNDLELKNVRLFICHPTDVSLEKISKLIDEGLQKPKCIWIVYSENLQLIPNFDKIIKILLWSKHSVSYFNSSILTIRYGNHITTTKKIIVEKIHYTINSIEKDIESHNSKIPLLLENLFFSRMTNNILNNKVKIYDNCECPICNTDFATNSETKSYLKCGHVMCSACLITIINLKNECPLCNKKIKHNEIIIPSIELTKINYLNKIIIKMINVSTEKNIKVSTIIYIDTLSLVKGLFIYINNFLVENNYSDIAKCIIVSQKTYNNNYNEYNNIFICQNEKNIFSQNIKNIKNVIIFGSNNDDIYKPESFGYDYCHNNNDVRVWIFNKK